MEEVKLDKDAIKKNPADRSNILSKLFFCWLIPYFVKGFKRELTEDDMYQHRSRHESKILGNRLERAWQIELSTKKTPSLSWTIIKVFHLELILYNFMIFSSEIIRLGIPLIISKLMRLYQLVDREEVQNEICIYAFLIVLISFIDVIIVHGYSLQMSQLAMKMRIACSSIIYRKTLRLNKTVLVDTTIGQMVNLLSNDVGRFDQAFQHIDQIWLGPIMALIVLCLTYINFGIMGMSGMLVLVGIMPLQLFLGKKSSEFRLRTAIRTDERVRLMNEIITGIQVIKMYTWEKPFAKLLELTRLNEIQCIRLSSTIKSILSSMSICSIKLSTAVAIIVYVANGNTLTSTYAYTVMSYYRITKRFNFFFPIAITQLAELNTSTERIQQFLLLDEKTEEDTMLGGEKFKSLNEDSLKIMKEKIGFKLTNVSAKWIKQHIENNLENVSMDIYSGHIIAIVGPVGCGKSSLLQIILKELSPSQGTVEIFGSISYASQEPWLFGGTIRQNIIFGQDFNQKRYEEIIRVCALERDLTLLPYGDKTRIGERGITLSGGQRARINLARAVYKEADIYLLDDPLSAVDNHVGKQLFHECINGFLSKKCVVLVTHQLQYLKNIKNIFLIENGRVRTSGSYENIKNSNSVLTKLLIDLEKEEEDGSKKGAKKSVSMENNSDEAPGLKREEKSTGKVTGYVYKSYLKAGGNMIKVGVIAFGFLLSQVLDSLSEYFITMWVNIQQRIDQNYTSNSTTISYYVSNQQWIDSIFIGPHTVYIYGILVILLMVTSFTRAQYFYMWCLKASIVLHNKMFDTIISSPMNFFDTNPSGRILNRFSYDMGNVDEVLPITILDTIQIGLNVLSIALVIATLSPWIIIPTIAILILFYLMRFVFLETSRDVKRVEAITRSPIFSHLTASLQGLTTIRAFRAQQLLASEFDKLQNLHSAAFFMYLGITRSFGFWLDFNCVVYVALVLAALLLIKGETFGGNIGLALTQAMTLTGMFQWGVRQWSELENKMTSVERIQEYIELPKEIEGDVQDPPETWPEKGEVVFNKLSLRYSNTLPYVLKNLSFAIKSKEKIGVVGRTGAGKSSLIQAMFRLTHTEGSIFIDDINTKNISLNKLRSQISIIPQEPVLFSGTLRKNLDPFDEYIDEVLWNALEEVELKSVISDLPDGLDYKMAEGGLNFSVGQRQLFCLARAIVRKNKILILDEATANVDLHTDSLIQTTIRKKFGNCTVITVAHRLHTIMDSDKVLVMDAGEILEYGNPHLLLLNTEGIFYSLLMQTGHNTAKNLMDVARKAYKLQNKNNE